MTIQQLFAQIIERPIVAELVTFGAPADSTQLQNVESTINKTVPLELATLWSEANGESESSEGLFGGYIFTPIEASCELIEDQLLLAKTDELRGLRFNTTHLGETSIFESGWIPIGNLFNRELILFDARQESKSFEYVFRWSLETGPGKLLAKSVGEFLSGIIHLLSDDDIESLDHFKSSI